MPDEMVEKVARAKELLADIVNLPHELHAPLLRFMESAHPETLAQLRAALAVMEREGEADDRLALVREDVIRMRMEQLFADKPVEQWGPMGLATALSPNVEALVAAAVSNERLRAASPRPEAVGEDWRAVDDAIWFYLGHENHKPEDSARLRRMSGVVLGLAGEENKG